MYGLLGVLCVCDRCYELYLVLLMCHPSLLLLNLMYQCFQERLLRNDQIKRELELLMPESIHLC